MKGEPVYCKDCKNILAKGANTFGCQKSGYLIIHSWFTKKEILETPDIKNRYNDCSDYEEDKS